MREGSGLASIQPHGYPYPQLVNLAAFFLVIQTLFRIVFSFLTNPDLSLSKPSNILNKNLTSTVL